MGLKFFAHWRIFSSEAPFLTTQLLDKIDFFVPYLYDFLVQYIREVHGNSNGLDTFNSEILKCQMWAITPISVYAGQSHLFQYMLGNHTCFSICWAITPVSVYAGQSHLFQYMLGNHTCFSICWAITPVSVYAGQSHLFQYMLGNHTCFSICWAITPVSVYAGQSQLFQYMHIPATYRLQDNGYISNLKSNTEDRQYNEP